VFRRPNKADLDDHGPSGQWQQTINIASVPNTIQPLLIGLSHDPRTATTRFRVSVPESGWAQPFLSIKEYEKAVKKKHPSRR